MEARGRWGKIDEITAGRCRPSWGAAENPLRPAARACFEAGRTPPARTSAPGKGPLYDFIVKRLFDSFNLPYGPVRYLELMHPSYPDGESLWSRLGLAPHGRAWVMVRQEWPKVRAEIDSGHPSQLGLVRVKST